MAKKSGTAVISGQHWITGSRKPGGLRPQLRFIGQKQLLLCVLFFPLWFCSAQLYATEHQNTKALQNTGTNQSIRFNIAPRGFPPFTIIDEYGEISGIMYEVFHQIANDLGYQVQPMRVPRKRESRMVEARQLDAVPRAIEWTRNPDDFVFSDEIVKVRDVLFSTTRAPARFNGVEDLFGQAVRAHLGFRYPQLDEHFASGRIERIDGTDNTQMLAALLRNPERISGVLMNEAVGLWVIKRQGWKNRIQPSDKAISEVSFRIMFGAQWGSFVEQFNQQLKTMKSDGRLEKIVSRYR